MAEIHWFGAITNSAEQWFCFFTIPQIDICFCAIWKPLNTGYCSPNGVELMVLHHMEWFQTNSNAKTWVMKHCILLCNAFAIGLCIKIKMTKLQQKCSSSHQKHSSILWYIATFKLLVNTIFLEIKGTVLKFWFKLNFGTNQKLFRR